MREITIGQYFPGNSILHRLDARMKIVLTIAIIVLIFVCKNFFSLALVALFACVCAAISGVPISSFLKSLRVIVIIVIFTAVLNIFYTTGDGEPLLSFWKIEIYKEGLFTAVFIAVRIVSLIVVSSLMTYTTTPTMLTDAIEKLLSPLKVFKLQVSTLAMMMTLALRFIPTLIEEIDRIMNAQRARGADFQSGGLLSRAKALVPVLVPLFVSAFRRAYELALAMECRCYRGGDGRTRMKQMRLATPDGAAMLVVSFVLLGIVMCNAFFEAVI